MGAIDAPILCSERGTMRDPQAEPARLRVEGLPCGQEARTQPDLRRLPAVIRFLGYDPRPPAEGIGGALKRYRQARGVSQEDLAAMLGVDPSTLANFSSSYRCSAPLR